MKRLLPFLLIVVFMRDGRVFKYPNATETRTVGGSQPLIGADTPDTVLQICRTWRAQPDDMIFSFKVIASFNLATVERWEDQ